MELNLGSKNFIWISLLMLSIISFSVAEVDKSGQWHSADDILISLGNYSMTLQEAIDNGFLVDGGISPVRSYTAQILGQSHLGEVLISLNGLELTLKDALLTSRSFCANSSYSSYSSNLDFGHFATEIEVLVGGSLMSFQDAIDSGKFCSSCVSNVGDSCDGNGCSNGSVIQCDGSCAGGVNVADGTACGTGYYLIFNTINSSGAVNKICESGSCVDCFSGTIRGNSCSECPTGRTATLREIWGLNASSCSTGICDVVVCDSRQGECFVSYNCYLPDSRGDMTWLTAVYCSGCDSDVWEVTSTRTGALYTI